MSCERSLITNPEELPRENAARLPNRPAHGAEKAVEFRRCDEWQRELGIDQIKLVARKLESLELCNHVFESVCRKRCGNLPRYSNVVQSSDVLKALLQKEMRAKRLAV